MDQEKLELYTDHLISNVDYATGLSSMLDGEISHPLNYENSLKKVSGAIRPLQSPINYEKSLNKVSGIS